MLFHWSGSLKSWCWERSCVVVISAAVFATLIDSSSTSISLQDYKETFEMRETVALIHITVSFLKLSVRKTFLPYFFCNLFLIYFALKYVKLILLVSSESLSSYRIILRLNKGQLFLWVNDTVYWFFFSFFMCGGLSLFSSLCLRFTLFRYSPTSLACMAGESEQL